jgi:hypothetical protein
VRGQAAAETWAFGVPCPDCGESVLVAVTAWPDGTREVACPEACDLDHLFTEGRRGALTQQALGLLEAELEESRRERDEAEDERG